MSQDGSWTDPEPTPVEFVPRSLPEPIKLPGTERTPEERIGDLSRELELRNTWIRQNRDTLQEAKQRAERAETIVAALVRKYGEQVHGNGYRLVLTDAELEDTPGVLSFNLDPNSGALLIRFRPE